MHGSSHQYVEYAGFWRRLLAFMIDTLLISLLSTIMLAILYGSEHLAQMQQITEFSQIRWQDVLLEQLIPALWTIGFWIILMATPGKLLLDCQIVDARTLQKARPTQLIIRYLAYLLSFLALGLGFFWIAFSKRRQGWHDKLANTVVILQDESRLPLEAYS
jgi:uncharacterized RDD family membrane protein YckC